MEPEKGDPACRVRGLVIRLLVHLFLLAGFRYLGLVMRPNKRAMYLKIFLSAIVVFGLMNWAVIVTDNNKREEELERFALAYAQAGVARAINRADTTVFLRARDSIASELGISAQMALDFSATFQGSEYELAIFWRKVSRITDSIVALHQVSPTDSSKHSSSQNTSSDPDPSDSGKSTANPIDILVKSLGDTF